MKKICKVIGNLNQIGGVAKTSTCRNLATVPKNEGYKVLAVDCDNQGSLTDCFGNENADDLKISLYELMMTVILVQDELPMKEEYIGLRKVLMLYQLILCYQIFGVSHEKAIDEIKYIYNFVLLDSMLSLRLMTLNVLASCDCVLILVAPVYLSAKGLELGEETKTTKLLESKVFTKHLNQNKKK